jgi:3-keto-L-gulonate-6-phosphate decarboxylase
VEHAAGSPDWLVRTEAALLTGNGGAAPSPSETYRRMRGGAAVQVALDLPDLGHARSVAEAAAEAGADLIEVGDPLIKSVGLRAITEIKRAVPETRVVAEMMSADWGRDQVELAVEVGADIALLTGLSSMESVLPAVRAANRLAIPLVLDVPGTRLTREWVTDMEQAGVDGFAITTNIDLGAGVPRPLDLARRVRDWTGLPVSVSGGFETTDHDVICSEDWDVVIVGRSVSESVCPADAVRQVVEAVRTRTKGRSNDDQTAR